MQAMAERARQALGVGRGTGFVASSLEPQHKTMEELAVYAAPLRRMLSSAEHFRDDTTEFLDTSCRFIRDTPFPRLWTQISPLEPAEALHTPVPAEHAAWFDAETHNNLADQVAPAVGFALQRELLGPLRQWLLAYDVLKATLSRLEGKRLAYDAERRRLSAAVAKASDAAAAGAAQSVSDEPSAAGSIAAAVEVAQLQEDAAAASPSLSEYESDVEALDDGLAWLVSGALRLKALIADTAGGVAAAARGWQVPQGLMPELEPSTFGKGYEVTMTVTDAPIGAETLLGPEAPPQATTVTPDLVAIKADEPGGSSSDETGGSKTVVGSMLPSDEMVYGGGVAPPPAAHSPSGGGVTDLIKDTLLGPADDTSTAANTGGSGQEGAAGGSGQEGAAGGSGQEGAAGGSGQEGTAGGSGQEGAAGGSSISDTAAARDAAGIPTDPDLSSYLPADDAMVYGGGMAPHPDSQAAPAGGGVTDLIKDTVLGPGSESADEAYHDAHSDADDHDTAASSSTEATSGGGFLSRIKDTVTRMVGTSGEGADTAAAGAGSGGDVDPIDPHELMSDRPSRSYSGGGVGQVEARLSDVAAAGLGAAGRHLRRARSDEGQPAAAAGVHTGLAAAPEVEVADADQKQLSTVVLPASTTAAAVSSSSGADTTFVDNAGTQPLTSTGAVAEPEDDAAAGSSGAVSGLFAAISRTIQEGRARLTGNSSHQQQQQQQEHKEEHDVDVTGAASAGDAGSGWEVDVQGAEQSGAPGAPGTPESVAGAPEPQVNPAAIHTEGGEGMHVGPVAPYPGHIASPGSAGYVKDAGRPGGAAGAGEQPVFDNSRTDTSDVDSGMHIGPVAPSPGSEPAPGSAHYEKGPTPPGGAAALGSKGGLPEAANISSNEAAHSSGMHIGPVAPEDDPGSEPAPGSAHYIKGPTQPGGAAAAEAPAGSSEEGVTAGAADLSKILPTYEQLPMGGSTTKPAGGGVGTFIRDTLLGPPKNE